MAFLLSCILCSLAVANIHNRVDDDSHTGLQTDGAPGRSLDETFCQRTNANGLLLQRVIYSCVLYVRGTLASGKLTIAELLHRYTLQTRGYLKFHFSPGYRRIFYDLKAKDGASMKPYLTGTITCES